MAVKQGIWCTLCQAETFVVGLLSIVGGLMTEVVHRFDKRRVRLKKVEMNTCYVMKKPPRFLTCRIFSVIESHVFIAYGMDLAVVGSVLIKV